MSYTDQECFEASVKYFQGDDLAARVFLDKYALRDNNNDLLEKTPEDMHRRMAREFARIEARKFKNPYTEAEIFSWFDHFKYIIPQGSPMFGIGNTSQIVSLSNCYVITSPADSYGGIFRADESLIQIGKRRGGVGLDVSSIRPKGCVVNNASKISMGVTTFMERFSNSTREIAQDGRRGALMLTLSVHHPEVLEFARIKQDLKKVTGANISIRFSDEFLEAVEKGTTYEQRFPVEAERERLISKQVDARAVWKEIVSCAWKTAEPGILFWDNILKESPADCYSAYGFQTTSTNPCAELPLCPGDSCRLMVVNLLSCVDKPFTKNAKFNFDTLKLYAGRTQRLMDDLVDLELEHIDRILTKLANDQEPFEVKSRELELWQEIRRKCEKGRRTGTGITALGDALAALNIKYGTPDSVELTSAIYKALKLGAYSSSVAMAQEIGSFGIWKKSLEEKCPYLLRLAQDDPELFERMQKYGRRNIALLTTAPTGSVSMMTQTTSGIEPAFALSYKRRKKVNPNDKNVKVDFVDPSGDSWQEFTVYHPSLKKWMEVTGEKDITKSPWHGACTDDLDWKARVAIQAAAQKHVDHAISSTVNLPENVTVGKVQEIYETAWKAGCKGITVYRKNSRTGVLLDETTPTSKYIKRPPTLSCDVYHVLIRGKKYFILVGLLEGQPYELFAGKNSCLSKEIVKGKITKMKRGHYNVVFDEDSELRDITQYLTDEEEAITRLVSMGLRHHNDLNFLVHQLEKVKGDLNSFSKAISRSLKKYIVDGSKVTGEDCPKCSLNGHKDTYIRKEGCVVCINCGGGKC